MNALVHNLLKKRLLVEREGGKRLGGRPSAVVVCKRPTKEAEPRKRGRGCHFLVLTLKGVSIVGEQETRGREGEVETSEPTKNERLRRPQGTSAFHQHTSSCIVENRDVSPVEPSQAKPNQAKPNDVEVKSSKAKPGQTHSSHPSLADNLSRKGRTKSCLVAVVALLLNVLLGGKFDCGVLLGTRGTRVPTKSEQKFPLWMVPFFRFSFFPFFPFFSSFFRFFLFFPQNPTHAAPNPGPCCFRLKLLSVFLTPTPSLRTHSTVRTRGSARVSGWVGLLWSDVVTHSLGFGVANTSSVFRSLVGVEVSA